MTAAIRTSGLTKRFGPIAVVDGVDLDVPSGSVFGFLGPNGSGKTTTIRMLLGLITPNEGTVEVLGHEMPRGIDAALPRVGSLVEGPAFYPWLSGRQNLARIDATGRSRDRRGRRRRIDTALERVGLTAAGSKRFRAYSLGMRQRLGLANALLERRDLLILDEPTNGMDPQGTREIRNLIRELAGDGATVFLSSHLLAEIEQVCTHVAVMNLGALLWQGPLDALQAGANTVLRVETPDRQLAMTVLARNGMSAHDDGRHVVADLDGHAPDVLNRELVEAGVRVMALSATRPSLEELFVGLTGEGFDVAR